MWAFLPVDAFDRTEWSDAVPDELLPRDPNCSACRNLLDLQAITAIKMLDRQIAKDWADGYGTDVDVLLDRRHALVEQLRNGPHA